MAQFPALPLWTDAYLADTSHLTTIEHGAYLLLLMAMWRSGGALPNDDKKLARFARLGPHQWDRMRDALMPFFTVSGGGAQITQGRLSDELKYVRDHAKKQADNARQRWENKTLPPVAVLRHPEPLYNGAGANPLADNDPAHAMAMPDRCQTDAPTPIPNLEIEPNGSILSETGVSNSARSVKGKKRGQYSPEFEAAWSTYPTDANMSKLKAANAFEKLSATDKDMCLRSIPAFRAWLKRQPSDYRVLHFVRYITDRRFEGHAGAGGSGPISVEDWAKRLANSRDHHWWSTPQWGPAPGQPGCRVPTEMLQAGDGAGWREYKPGRAA